MSQQVWMSSFLKVQWANLLVLPAVLWIPLSVYAASEIPDGKVLFASHCAICHGGDGSVSDYGQKLKPFPARNLRAVAAWVDRDELRRFIVYGAHDTAMASKKYELDALEIEAIIDYIQTFTYHINIKSGRKRFEAICSICHGKDGRAQTGLGAKNLVYTKLDLQEIVRTMRYGRSGTMMSSKRHQLSNSDIADIANYVYSLRYMANEKHGKKLYDKTCASCHTNPNHIKVTGNAASRKTLVDLDDRLLDLRIRHGRHVNRAGKRVVGLSQDNMHDIIAYLRQSKASRKVFRKAN